MISFGLFDEHDITLLRKCAVFYLAVSGDISEHGFNFGRATEITPHKIKTELYPMIRSMEHFDLQAARDRVFSFLTERMALNGKEAVFLERFASGKYEPELLFDDDEIPKRIENHPMALWRIGLIRQKRDERQ
jgi:hypothetical protein